MYDSMFDKMLAHLQLKGSSTSEELQASLQIHFGNLLLYIEIARVMGLVREMSDGNGWQLTDEGRKYCNLRAVASKEENRPKEGEGQFILLNSNNLRLRIFNSLHEAEEKARDLAIKFPGKTYRIVKVVAEVFCGEPKVRRF